MTDALSFAIPARPKRQYDRAGRLSYEGSVLFRLVPVDAPGTELSALLDTVLRTGPYRHGDFHDLPMVVYLVRDEGTGDVFRVSIRDGAIQLHVLPATDAAGLRQFYDRLREVSDTEWDVERRVEAVPESG